jgi:hypothetical protein
MAAKTLDARTARFSTEQLKDAANDSGDALLPIAYFVSTQRTSQRNELPGYACDCGRHAAIFHALNCRASWSI